MNQQKNYQKHRKTHCFLGKRLSFLIILVLFFSILSNIIIPITTAAPTAINNDDPKTQTTVETKDTDIKTSTPSTESKTEPTIEPTKTTSTPTSSKDDSQTTSSQISSSDTSNSDTKSTSTTSSTETTDATISNEKLTTDQQNNNDTFKINGNNSSDPSLTDTKTSSYEITLIDKTTEIQSYNSTVKSNNTTSTTSTCNLYQEGEIGDISKDDQVVVKTSTEEENKSIITEINFTASTNQKNVRVTLSEYDEEPEEVTNNLSVSPSKKVYKYIDVKLTANETYIGETGIETMTFTFTVEKDWIETNNLNKETIVMMRYHNDTWGNLNTTFVNESEEFIYFKAETPGLSVFAVVGDTIVEDSDAIVDETIQIPIWLSFGVIASSSALLGVVLVKKRFIYRG